MKSIQNLIENLKDLIAEATQNRTRYENIRLIPVPVKSQNQKLTNNNNQR